MTRILQISDPHVLAPPQLVCGRLDTVRLFTSAIDRMLADWEKFGPVDAVVVTGDITNDGDADSYRIFHDQVSRLPAPILLIPGNHDRRELLRAQFSSAPEMPKSGKINWVHDLSDMRIIGLDTLIEGESGGELGEETLAFLASTLQAAAGRPILIALHHPPFRCGIQFMDAIGLRDAAMFEKILQSATCEIRIICGHIHSTAIATVAGHTAISSASTASAIPADFRIDAPVGFTTHPGGYMIHIWDDGFRSTAIPLSEGGGPYPFHPDP